MITFSQVQGTLLLTALWEAWQSIASLLLAVRADKSCLLLDTAAKVATGLTGPHLFRREQKQNPRSERSKKSRALCPLHSSLHSGEVSSSASMKTFGADNVNAVNITVHAISLHV